MHRGSHEVDLARIPASFTLNFRENRDFATFEHLSSSGQLGRHFHRAPPRPAAHEQLRGSTAALQPGKFQNIERITGLYGEKAHENTTAQIEPQLARFERAHKRVKLPDSEHIFLGAGRRVRGGDERLVQAPCARKWQNARMSRSEHRAAGQRARRIERVDDRVRYER